MEKRGNPNWHKGMESPNPRGRGNKPKRKGNNPYGRNGKPQFLSLVIKGVENFLKSPF